jgi:hypothetical protein
MPKQPVISDDNLKNKHCIMSKINCIWLNPSKLSRMCAHRQKPLFTKNASFIHTQLIYKNSVSLES